jgi:hypothetical protein
MEKDADRAFGVPLARFAASARFVAGHRVLSYPGNPGRELSIGCVDTAHETGRHCPMNHAIRS